MANPHRGEASLQAGERGELVLRLTLNVRAEIEKMLGDGFPAILSRWSDGQWKDTELRAVFWGALKTRQPQIGLQEAGDLIDQLGSEAVVKAISEAYIASQPPRAIRDGQPGPP